MITNLMKLSYFALCRMSIVLCFVFSMFIFSNVATVAYADDNSSGKITADNNDFIAVLCKIIEFMSQGIVKLIIGLVLIFLGVMLIVGRVPMQTAIITACGIGLIVGAPRLGFMIASVGKGFDVDTSSSTTTDIDTMCKNNLTSSS